MAPASANRFWNFLVAFCARLGDLTSLLFVCCFWVGDSHLGFWLAVFCSCNLLCLVNFYFVLTCVPSVLFPSSVPCARHPTHADFPRTAVSHQPCQRCPGPSVSPPALHPLISLVCIEARVVRQPFIGSSVFIHVSPVTLPRSVCSWFVPCGFLVFPWYFPWPPFLF